MKIIKYSIVQANKRHGSKFWYGRINENGNIKYITLKTKHKREAQEWLNYMNSKRFMPEVIEENEGLGKNIVQAINAFIDMTESSKGRNSQTLLSYTSKLNLFKNFLKSQSVVSFKDFTSEIAVLYAHEQGKFAPKTSRERLRLVEQFIKWAIDVYKIKDYNPMKNITKPKLVKRFKEFWTMEQLEQILEQAPDKYWRFFWALMAYLGLRHAEAVSFNACNISGNYVVLIGKGNKQAKIPFNERIKAEYERLGHLPHNYFKDKCFENASSNRNLKKIVKRLGIEGGATNHRFRHSFASNLIRAGANIKAVQSLMRHESSQITLDTYGHLLQDDLKKTADLL